MQTANLYIVMNKKNYFAIAEEYVQLKQLFKTDTFYEKLSLFMSLVGNVIMSILFKSNSMSLALTCYQTFEKLRQYTKFLGLKKQVTEWKEIVQSVGGPFISTNDETYHAYVYADGMQRLHDDLFGLTKKGPKRL